MGDRHRRQWEALGASDPYWAVLTDRGTKNGRWDRTAFFQTGTAEIDGLLGKIRSLGVPLGCDVALDYGCGVGRLSRALSRSFQRVLAVDFSETMLAEARSANVEFLDRLQFRRNNGRDLEGVADHSVDLVYSTLVLQHIPQETMTALIREFGRVLRPGAVLVVQIPSRPCLTTIHGFAHFVLGNRILNQVRRIKHGQGCVMELYTMPRNEVLRILAQERMSLLEAERDDSTGSAFISYRYFARKN